MARHLQFKGAKPTRGMFMRISERQPQDLFVTYFRTEGRNYVATHARKVTMAACFVALPLVGPSGIPLLSGSARAERLTGYLAKTHAVVTLR